MYFDRYKEPNPLRLDGLLLQMQQEGEEPPRLPLPCSDEAEQRVPNPWHKVFEEERGEERYVFFQRPYGGLYRLFPEEQTARFLYQDDNCYVAKEAEHFASVYRFEQGLRRAEVNFVIHLYSDCPEVIFVKYESNKRFIDQRVLPRFSRRALMSSAMTIQLHDSRKGYVNESRITGEDYIIKENSGEFDAFRREVVKGMDEVFPLFHHTTASRKLKIILGQVQGEGRLSSSDIF